MSPAGERRARALLLLGAAAGVLLAAAGMLGGSSIVPARSADGSLQAKAPEPLPAEAVARVNGRLILRRDFEDLLALEVAGGMSSEPAQKRQLVQMMIDEELRVQRAIELGLHRTDARVRMDLASAVADAAVAKAEREAPDEAALREYFERRREFFVQRGPLRIRQIWVAVLGGNLGEAFTRARTAVQLLRENEEFETIEEIFGSSQPRPVPDRLLHPDDLAQHIGLIALDAALALEPGEISEPIRGLDGFHVIQVLERLPNEARRFEDSRLEVEAEYWRELARDALAANAAELRRGAEIEVAESF